MNVQESNWLRQVAMREEQARERWLRARLAPKNTFSDTEPVPIALPPVQMVGSKVRPVERIDTVTMPLAGMRTTDITPMSLEWPADPPYVAPKVGQPRDMYPRWNPRLQIQTGQVAPANGQPVSQVPVQASYSYPSYPPEQQQVFVDQTFPPTSSCSASCSPQCGGACGSHIVSGLVPHTVVSQRVVPVTRTVPVRQQTVELQPVVRERTVMQQRTEYVNQPVKYDVLVPEQRVQHVHTHTHAAPQCSAAQSAPQAWSNDAPVPYSYTTAPTPMPAALPQPLPPHPTVQYAYTADGVLHRADDNIYNGGAYGNDAYVAPGRVSTYDADYNAGTWAISRGTEGQPEKSSRKAYIEPEMTCAPCVSQSAMARAVGQHGTLSHSSIDCARHTGYPHSNASIPVPDAPPVPSVSSYAATGRSVTDVTADRCAVCACDMESCPGHHNQIIYTHTPTQNAPNKTLYVGVVTKLKGRDVTVLGVRPGSPAHYAGILPGDVIHAVSGVRVDSTEIMHKLFELHGQARRVSGCLPVGVTVRRHGKLVCLMLTPQMKY